MAILLTLIGFMLATLLAVLLGSYLWTRKLARGAEQLVPQVGEIAPVTGGTVHFIDRGPRDGIPLVLIHGLSGQIQNFTYALTEKLEDEFRVITIDRPGAGYASRDSDDLAALPEQARMIGEFLDKRGIENPVLVGHSLGGAVALAMALDRPQKTRALALLAPLTQFQPTAPEVFKGLEIRSGWIRRLVGHTLAVPVAKRTADETLTEVFRPEPWPADFLVRGGGALGLRPQSYVTASADLAAVESSIKDVADRYADGLHVPGGVLYGVDDAILSAQFHGAPMAEYGLTYEELPDRGHMIPLTAAQDCASFIRRMAAKGTT